MGRTEQLLARLAAVECPAFGHRRRSRAGAEEGAMPLVLASGEGAELTDADGRRYLDLCAGFGAVLLGHRHPRWTAAVQAQLGRLVQGMGDVHGSEPKVALLEKLAAIHPSGNAQVLLAQSGGDAMTAAIKTAVLATRRPLLVAFEGAYHGLGYAPLAACGFRPSFRAPFAEQLGGHVRFVPFPREEAEVASALAALESILASEQVAAVLLEPILGRGGCVVPPAGFAGRVRALARARGTLLVADEIWTGFRTGELLRSQADGAEADILCLGKGLGGGISIAACIASAEVMAGWTRSGEVVHTSTHVGAPLGCAAALATLEVVEDDDLIARAARVGGMGLTALRAKLGDRVRGAGLMIGVELGSAVDAQRVSRELLERGYLVLTGGVEGNVLTLTPPLTFPETAWGAFADALASVV
jgi:4-aminobutyrate aminotransferase / (S)-3-amino-2-methylpropionate transaminase / 5-aminovalerate transaminase